MGGATAWDARLELVIRTISGTSWPFDTARALGRGSDSPNGVRPVKISLARPSRKLRTLNTALITDGALRGVTCLMFQLPIRNAGESRESMPSSRPVSVSAEKILRTIPADPERWPESRRTDERLSLVSEKTRKGKSSETCWWFASNGPLGFEN
jgi:hypothetical protein